MPYQQKQVGGICPDCGGKYVQNPKTQKIFCENKCWLNPSMQKPKQDWVKPEVRQQFAKPAQPAQQVDKPNWPAIREEKADDIRGNVALKGAIDLVTSGKINLDEWETWANTLFNYKPSKRGEFFENETPIDEEPPF